MIRALRLALAYRRIKMLEWDMAYWRSMKSTAEINLAQTQEALVQAEIDKFDLQYPVPKGVSTQ